VTVGIQHFAPVLSFRGLPAWKMDPSYRMEDLDAEASPVFPFLFFSSTTTPPIVTMSCPNVKSHPSTIHIHTYFWTFVCSSTLLILGLMARICVLAPVRLLRYIDLCMLIPRDFCIDFWIQANY